MITWSNYPTTPLVSNIIYGQPQCFEIVIIHGSFEYKLVRIHKIYGYEVVNQTLSYIRRFLSHCPCRRFSEGDRPNVFVESANSHFWLILERHSLHAKSFSVFMFIYIVESCIIYQMKNCEGNWENEAIDMKYGNNVEVRKSYAEQTY